MPRGKCGVKSTTASRKTRANQPKEKLTAKKQTLSKDLEIFGGVDSLSFLKDTKERKKPDDIDGRIMLLKSELQLLMDDEDCNREDKSLGNLQKIDPRAKEARCNMTSEHPRDDKGNKMKEFKPSSNSTPCKFTGWLDNITDEANSHCQNKTIELHDTNNSSLISEPKTGPSIFNRFSQNKVEELLYKTFLKQNATRGLSDLPSTSSKNISSKKETKKQENCDKSETTYKQPCLEKPAQRKNKCSRVSKRGRKKRRVSLHTSDSDMEVIDLDDTQIYSEGSDRDAVCIDLDVGSYDWAEPFDLQECDHHKSHSDVQIISETETEDSDISKKELKPRCPEQKEGCEGSNSDSVEQQAKKVWECPVCLDQSRGQEIVATQCGHVFCKTCLETHTSKVQNNCPTCRTDLSNKPVITLFNF